VTVHIIIERWCGVGRSPGWRRDRCSTIGRDTTVTRYWDTRWRLHKADWTKHHHSDQEEPGTCYLLTICVPLDFHAVDYDRRLLICEVELKSPSLYSVSLVRWLYLKFITVFNDKRISNLPTHTYNWTLQSVVCIFEMSVCYFIIFYNPGHKFPDIIGIKLTICEDGTVVSRCSSWGYQWLDSVAESWSEMTWCTVTEVQRN